MAKSDASSQKAAGEKLEAPVQLTPEQLEAAAGGLRAQVTPVKGTATTTTGAAGPKIPDIKI